jgi:hypothetical protein
MRRIVAAIGAIAALVLVSLASLGATSTRDAHAATWIIEGWATGAEEVPTVNTPGRAFVRFVFNDVTNTMSYAVTQSGFSADQVTAAHIHRGSRGVNGPIVHNLSTTGFVQVAGTLNLSAADVADLRAGNFYFNIHSSANPGGYARMQLLLPTATQVGGTLTVPHNIPPAILAQIPPAYRAELVPGTPIEPFLLAQIPANLRQQLMAAGRPGGAPGPITPPRTGSGGFNGYSDTLLPLLFVLAFAAGGASVIALARRRA